MLLRELASDDGPGKTFEGKDNYLRRVSLRSSVMADIAEDLVQHSVEQERTCPRHSPQIHDFCSSMNLIGLIKATALAFRTDSSLFLAFMDWCHDSTPSVRVSCTMVSEDPNSVDMVTIITAAAGGQVYPISSVARLEEPPSVVNTFDIRICLLASDNPWETFLNLPSRWVSGVAELVQTQFDIISDEVEYRRRCLSCLRKLARQFGVLPPSFLVNDISCHDDRPITGGGYADIWKGRQAGREVCVKVIRMFTSEDLREEIFKDFSHEAIIWKQLHHPNILPFLGVNVELYYPSFSLVSPWMLNGDVITFLARDANRRKRGHAELTPLSALKDVSEGLKYLHSLTPQIVHADIKGANVLVKDDLTCCLADFGISLVTESQEAAHSISIPHRGSVRWLCPEAISPSIYQNPRLTARDIYAFGCLIVEIYTGRPPFSEIKLDITVGLQVLAGVRPGRPDALVDRDGVWNLATACWAPNPEERPEIAQICAQLQEEHRVKIPKDVLQYSVSGRSAVCVNIQICKFFCI
ncbi:kinase-like domain-containing protein [Mycena floridula]|nr:kinase-like domain-containing protein [Mycena floridula]